MNQERLCKKCNNYIPYCTYVEGKRKSLQNRKFCLTCSPYKEHNTKDLTKVNTSKNLKEESKKKQSQYVMDYRNKMKLRAVKYKGGKCLICHYNRCIRALEFHHIDPSNKDFSITSSTKSWKSTKKEVDKCILVCANCHREVESGLVEIVAIKERHYLIDNKLVIEKPTEDYFDIYEKIEESKQIYLCKNCNKEIGKTINNLCKSCFQISTRKVNRPAKEELEELIKILPFTKIASIYNVTDNAIRKWCKDYNLPTKYKEILLLKNT